MKSRLTELLDDRFLAGESRRGIIGVVRPRSEAELSQVLRIASEAHAKVSSRGAGSSPYAPARRDRVLVLSLSQMNRVLEVDEPGKTARLESGATWQSLIEAAAEKQLMPLTYPSSRDFTTVGGFIAQGGYGVGSYEFGQAQRQVISVRLVSASGGLAELKAADLGLVVGARGATGIISELTLTLQPLQTVDPVVCLFPSFTCMATFMAASAREELPLWSAALMDPRAAAFPAKRGVPREPPLPAGRFGLLLGVRRTDLEVRGQRLRQVVREAEGDILETDLPHDVWVNRFMAIQVFHTTPIPMQYCLSPARAVQLMERLPEELNGGVSVEGVWADRGREVVLRFFLAPDTLPSHNTLLAHELGRLAEIYGAKPYGVLNPFGRQAARLRSARETKRLEDFRAAQDPDGLLNPLPA